MQKIIKKFGGSLIILFDKEDCKIHGLNEGDVLDIEIVKINSSKKVKK